MDPSASKRRRFWQHPVALLLAAIVLLATAAVLFFVIGLRVDQEAKQELPKLLGRPSDDPNFGSVAVSFSKLAQAPLRAEDIETVVTGIPEPHGLAVLDGALFSSGWSENRLYRLNLQTKERTLVTDELEGAHDFATDDDGNLVTPLYKAGRVVRINPRDGRISTLVEGLGGPNGIARARDGGFYVTEATAGRVVKLSDSGELRVVAEGLKEPAGVIADSDNILLVAQYADAQNSVVQIADNGTVTVAVTGITNAESLLRDNERNLIIGHSYQGKAAMSIVPRGQAPRLLLATGFPLPMVGPVTDNQYLYFESAAAGQSAIYRIKLP